jgi:hypothetical protein
MMPFSEIIDAIGGQPSAHPRRRHDPVTHRPPRLRLLLAAAALAVVPAAAAHASMAPAAATVHVHGFRLDPGQHPSTHLPERRGSARNGAAASDNWSGYADVACGTCALRYVAATFTVPSVNCDASPANAYVSEWVGLDGWGNSTVEQTGLTAFCVGGQPSYYAWYEMYPGAPVAYTAPMNPGDAITTAVYFDASTGLYQLALDDVTAGDSLAVSEPCPAGSACANSSADVITEAPSLGGTLPLADYGQMSYVDAQVTSRNGTHGDLAPNRLWSTDSITMDNPAGQVSTPSPAEGGQAFYVTWSAS